MQARCLAVTFADEGQGQMQIGVRHTPADPV
jgi:hypothetical protein